MTVKTGIPSVKASKDTTLSKAGAFKISRRTYSVKVKVTAKGNANYKAKTKNVTLKIKVK